ncbi:hypothetical protein [Burkholderia glumae]
MSSILPTQAYELKLAPHPAPFSVLEFSGRDAVSELYHYDICQRRIDTPHFRRSNFPQFFYLTAPR